MKKALALTIALVCLALAPSASAQVARTWVSQDGSDANDCSFGSPCLSFTRATVPLVEGGEINARTDGNFGEFVIDKGMTVDGRGHSVSITAFGNGITVNAPAAKVTVRDLHIQGFPGAGDGIQVTNVAHLRLRDVTIRTMDGHGVDFRDPPVPSRLTVLDSSISEGEREGIAVAPSAAGTAGGFKRVVVRNSDISSNVGSGIWTGAPAVATANPLVIGVFDSTLADNGANGLISHGANTRTRIAQNVITGNIGFGLRALNSGQVISYGNNRIFENGTNGAPTSVVSQN
jgi:hypothetical protein